MQRTAIRAAADAERWINEQRPNMEKLTLSQQAEVVGSILNEYIAVHNDVFKFRWRRLLPLGIWFEAIDFHAHVVALKSMEEEVERIRVAVVGEESALAETLAAYTMALEDTMSELRGICAGLDVKRSGSDTYTWNEYQKDHERYKNRVRKYQAIGSDLNRELQLLQASILR